MEKSTTDNGNKDTENTIDKVNLNKGVHSANKDTEGTIHQGNVEDATKDIGGTIDQKNADNVNKDTETTIDKQDINKVIDDANTEQEDTANKTGNEADKQLKSSLSAIFITTN